MDSSTPKTRKIVHIKNGKIDTETRRSGRSKETHIEHAQCI